MTFRFNAKNSLAALMAVSVIGFSPAAFANERLFDKPVVRQVAIGAAVGAAGGLLSDRTSVAKGTLTGAAVGAGTGLVGQTGYFQQRPLVCSAVQGAIVGTGTSYATEGSLAKGALLGAGAGAGYHYVRQMINRW